MNINNYSILNIIKVMMASSVFMIKKGLSKISPTCWFIVGIIFSLALITLVWFVIFPYRTFMGDDLSIIVSAQSGGYGSSFIHALTQTTSNKYRPVSEAFFHLELSALGNNFRSYVYLNIFLQFLNACLVSFISYRLSRKQLLIALVSGIMFIVSRFSYYNVLQVVGGSLEGLALFLFLLMIITTMRTYKIKKSTSFVWPLLLYFLLIFTHERYVVVGGFLVAAIILAPINFKRHYHRFLLAIVPLMILIINYALKTFIFKSRFFEGTGGQAITFDYQQFLLFLFTGFVNMFGFNFGPDYLSGLSIFRVGFYGFALGSILTVSFIALICAYIYYHLRSTPKVYLLSGGKNIFLFTTLLFPLLAAASITIRQEYRWLYAPYIVVIFGMAYLSGRISSPKWIRSLIIIFILTSAISVDTFYRGYLNNVFFIDGLRVADSAKDNIIDKYESNLSQKELFLIGASRDVKSWYFMDDAFFIFYTGDPKIHINYVDGLEEIKNYQIDTNSTLVFYFSPLKREVTDVTLKARAALINPSNFSEESSIDFLANIDPGKISNTYKVSTPTGYGVFIMDWPNDLDIEKSLTVISGFNYTYNNVLIKNNEFLSFTAGIPLESGDGALAYIEIATADGERKRIFRDDLAPALEQRIRWESFLIPFNDYAGQKVAITFGVESPSGNYIGDWVAFGFPRLLLYE